MHLNSGKCSKSLVYHTEYAGIFTHTFLSDLLFTFLNYFSIYVTVLTLL